MPLVTKISAHELRASVTSNETYSDIFIRKGARDWRGYFHAGKKLDDLMNNIKEVVKTRFKELPEGGAADHGKAGYTVYMMEVEPERYALDVITEKNKGAVINNLRKGEGMLFVGQFNDTLIASYRSKDNPTLKIPGAQVKKITPMKGMWGCLAEY